MRRFILISTALSVAFAAAFAPAPPRRAGAAQLPSPTPTPSPEPQPEQEGAKFQQDKEKELSEPRQGVLLKAPNAQVQTDLDTGEIRTVEGAITVTGATTATQAAELFIDRQSELLLKPDTLVGKVKAVREVESLTGTHVVLARRYNGLPVFDNEVAVTVSKTKSNLLRLLNSEMQSFTEAERPPPQPDSTAASAAAVAALRAEDGVEDTDAELEISTPTLGYIVEGERALLAWNIIVSTRRPLAVWDVLVDADTNNVLGKSDIGAHFVDGRGWVYAPNPVHTTGIFTLSDMMGGPDANVDAPLLTNARIEVTLRELDGTGRLRGRFATTEPTGMTQPQVAHEPTLNFNYTRSNPFFEEVMAYYWVTEAQSYRLLLMGSRTIQNLQMLINVHAAPGNSSQYNAKMKRLEFGDGGVDDAEDAEVILHEMGHAILDDIACGVLDITECRSWTKLPRHSEQRALGEGFSDYWAASFLAQRLPLRPEWCVLWGKWGIDPDPVAGGGPAFKRRLDNTLTFPNPWSGEEHQNGQIWAGALWQIREILGPRAADELILESLHYMTSKPRTFANAAEVILDTQRSLHEKSGYSDPAFDSKHQRIRSVFTDRQIPITP